MNRSRQYIEEIIDQHQQRSHRTCIPSAVEMVLKLLGNVDMDYYDLQDVWTNGSFANFDGQTVSGVTFQRINLAERGPTFPCDQLFGLIDQELASDRYVIISLYGMSSRVLVSMHMSSLTKTKQTMTISQSRRHPRMENM